MRYSYDYGDSLAHYGVQGMRWGIRRTPEELGHLNLSKARLGNLDSWGKSPSTNVCYVAGYSGSGKSTTALSMARPGDTVIHLDGYSEPDISDRGSIQNKKFNTYLNQTVPGWRKIGLASSTPKKGQLTRHSKEYWEKVDAFAKAIESFGAQEFKSGHRVICEGVQIADDWLHEDKSFYASKPTVILNTNPVKSYVRASARDEKALVKDATSMKEYIKWYSHMSSELNDLAKETNAKRGKDAIDMYLKKAS